MRSGKATAAPRRQKRLPRLHQPTFHVTAMVAVAALVSAFAAATPSLHGSFVGGGSNAKPAAVVAQGGGDGVSPAADVVDPTSVPTYSTTVAPPPNTTVGTGPGHIATILFSDPNSGTALASPLASDGIPVTALEAYQNGANSANATDPGCHIPWPLLAGIGRVESDHGRYGGAILRADGTSTKPIIGIPLNGNGTEVVTDTDGGSIDGDPVYDRAVGPMQFIPSTWLIYGADGNGDGIKDPFNIFDAALAAADYLCAAGGDLSTTAGQTRAVLSYNHSTAYLDEVLALEHTYASGDPGLIIPDPPVVVPPLPTTQPGGQPVPPPVDPGPPLGVTDPGTGNGTGGPSHSPKPHPTTTAPHGGSGSSTGTGGTTSTPPSDPTTTPAPTGDPSTTPGSPDPSGTTTDPTPTDPTTPADPGTTSDTPSCPPSTDPATDGASSTDAPTDAAPAAQVDARAAAPEAAGLSSDAPAAGMSAADATAADATAADQSAADSTDTPGSGTGTDQPSGTPTCG